MSLRATCVLLMLSSLPASGCGTVANLARHRPESGGRVPFGGVKTDIACYRSAANGEVGFRTRHHSDDDQYPRYALMMFCAADLPLSLIGDAVTWPYTASYFFINQPVPTPPVLLAVPTPPVSQPTPLGPVPPLYDSVPGPQPPQVLPDMQGPNVDPGKGEPKTPADKSVPEKGSSQGLPGTSGPRVSR